MTNAAKQQFTDRVSNLIKELGDSRERYTSAKLHLEHLLGHDWVVRLENAMDADRGDCQTCGLDFEAWAMFDDHTCLGCSRQRRITEANE